MAKCCWSGNEALCDVILTAQLIIIANIRLDDEVCKFCWTEQVPVTSFKLCHGSGDFPFSFMLCLNLYVVILEFQ